MKKLEVFGRELKSDVKHIGSEFIECSYMIDVIYEYFEDNDIDNPNSIEVYSDDQIDSLLNFIYDNRDLEDYLLGQLVYDFMTKMK